MYSEYSYQLQFSAVSGDFGLKICKIYGYDFSGTLDIFIIKQHGFEILYHDSWYTHYVQERHLTAMFKFKSNHKLNLHTLNAFVGNTRITTFSTKQTTLLQSTFFIILFISLCIIKTSHNTCQHKFTYGFFFSEEHVFYLISSAIYEFQRYDRVRQVVVHVQRPVSRRTKKIHEEFLTYNITWWLFCTNLVYSILTLKGEIIRTNVITSFFAFAHCCAAHLTKMSWGDSTNIFQIMNQKRQKEVL